MSFKLVRRVATADVFILLTRILTKPVLERALRETLAIAEERRKESRRSSNLEQSTSSCSHASQSKVFPLSPQPSSTESSQLLQGP